MGVSDEWAAGFFDGEGSISIRPHSHGRSERLYVAVSQRSRAPLEALRETYGGSVSKTRTPSNCHRWRITGVGAEAFLRRIQPHALVKREPIAIALEFRATKGLRGRRLAEGVREHRAALRARLMHANRIG